MRSNNRQRSRGGRNGGGGGGGHHHKQHHNPNRPPNQPLQANGNGYANPGERGSSRDDRGEAEPGLGGVAFLQNGRNAPSDGDPAADDQPDIPEYAPGERSSGRRGGQQ